LTRRSTRQPSAFQRRMTPRTLEKFRAKRTQSSSGSSRYFVFKLTLHQALCAELTWKIRITWRNRIIGQTYSQALLEMTSLQRTTTARFLRFSPLPSPAEYICGCLFWELSLSACQQTLGHRLPHTLVALSMGTYLKEDNSHRLTVCMAREFEASLYRPSSPSQPKPAADFWRLGAALHSWCV
jgi:hypothetical protein